MSNKWFLHVDLDAFFASVEQLDFPEYRGKPVIVGGLPTDKRSVVSTASYEARKFGVHSAMPTFQAYRLCPQGIFVHGRMKRYAELSYQIMNIFKDYSPDVNQMSIDEAFIDLTGTEKLFGPPEETAKRLKKEVKEKTGLTVSVGLAPTKYLAKIASGLSKPDGFYIIKQGEEESFMLNLPLNKVWGLGSKSLEVLRKKAINSTRDIYNLPYENLEFMFGKNMASFLYEAVRGNEMESFNTKPKSHSISAETTFPEDITDSYTAETQLLEMAQGVMFRLLKEEAVSKTVTIKIRYNDFSTFTIQETQDTPVSTIDSFYEIAKRLLEKKYTEGRGIRLLGIGFDNITKDQGPVQQQLFEDKQKEKKQKVEQAILKMKLKNPDIKIQKARTLKAIFIAALALKAGLFTARAYAEESVTKKGAGTTLPDTLIVPEAEASESLFEWDISDTKHVDFSLEGFWKGEFTGGAALSWSSDNLFAVSGTIPIYKQEVELSASIMLNNHWYFSGDFADSFKTNTITAGYQGQGFVRSVKLSNRNITMPDDYSANTFGFGISGGQNQAPGISANFKSSDNRHQIDTLLRYDVTASKSAVFYGMNSVTDSKIAISEYAYGRLFTFPETEKQSLAEIKNIYVENKNGTYRDKNGKRYKKVSSAEYKVLVNQSSLIFSDSAGTSKTDGSVPTILLTFTDGSTPTRIQSATGSYDQADTFAGKIQQLFNKAAIKYSLADYAFSLTTSIEGENALVIQNSYGFSPYLSANLYDCGLNKDADFSVISASSEKTSTRFTAEEYQNASLLNYEDFFKEDRLFAQVEDALAGELAGGLTGELAGGLDQGQRGAQARSASYKFPFASTVPEIYLNLPYETDLVLLARIYQPVTSLFIGTKAAAGTVQVYKNGNLEKATYDSSSGTIELSSSISQTDKITVYWQEEDTDFSSGTITSGLGYKYDFTKNLHGDLALTSKIPVTLANTLATQDSLEQGFAALSGGILYENEKIKLEERTAASVQKLNATGKLLVCAQPDARAQTYYLSASSGYSVQQEPQGFLEADEYTVKKFTGLTDSKITGYKIPISWDFSSSNTATKPWAAADIKLQAGNLLKNTSEVEFALLSSLPSTEDASNYELYIQLGVHAGADKYGEDDNLPIWKIQDFDFSSKDWQTVRFSLSDKDRARFISNYDARIIISVKDGSNFSSLGSGTVYAGPYELITRSIYTQQSDDISVNTSCQMLTSKNFSSRITWHAENSSEDYTDKSITAVSYFEAADFSYYKGIDFTFALNAISKSQTESTSNIPALTFILDTDAPSATEDGSEALRIELSDYSTFINDTLTYHTIRADLEANKLYVDGSELNAECYSLYINKNIIPTREKIQISLISGGTFYSAADFFVNNLIYSETDFTYSLQNYVAAQYKTEKVLTIKEKEILKDAEVKVTSHQYFSDSGLSVKSEAKGGITAGPVRIEADTSLKDIDFYKAGHKIESKAPLFGLLSFKENYRYNKEDSSLSKEDSAGLDFSSLGLPLKLTAQTTASSTAASARQNANALISTEIPIKSGSINFSTKAETKQKINILTNSFDKISVNNYINSWKDISELEFSPGSSNASSRQSNLLAKAGGTIPLTKVKISPETEYSLSALYADTSLSLTDKTSLKFALPFATKFQTISFSMEKAAEGATYPYAATAQSSYLTDTEELFALQNKRLWFYEQAPFYDFFDQQLADKINANYTSKYELQYNRKLLNSVKDLWLPSSVKFSASRIIEKSDSSGDLYQFKSTVTNTALNMFGKNGRLSLFTWFNQDELYTSFSGIVKVPLDIPENTSYQLSCYLQELFYITSKAYITSALEVSFETDKAWLTRGTFIYTRPSKDCLFYALTRLFKPTLSTDKVSVARKDSLNLELASSDNTFKQKYEYKHSADFTLLQYFTITTGLGLSYTRSHGTISTNIFAIDATIGAKAEF